MSNMGINWALLLQSGGVIRLRSEKNLRFRANRCQLLFQYQLYTRYYKRMYKTKWSKLEW